LARLIDPKAKISFNRPGSYAIRRGAGQTINVTWGPEARGEKTKSEMLCLADPKRGLLSDDPKKCEPEAITFSGAGLLSLFNEL